MKRTLRTIAFGLVGTLSPFGILAQNDCGIEVDKDLTIDEAICTGESAQVLLADPQSGVSYELVDQNTEQAISQGTLVNDSVEFTTGALTSSQDLAVFGTREQNTALKLAGGSDHLAWDATGFDYENGYTFEAMVNTSLSGSHKTLFYAGGAAGSDIEIYIQQNTHHLVCLHNRDNAGAIGSIIYMGAIPENQWFHLAVVNDGATTSLYINGVMVLSGAVPAIARGANAEAVVGYFKSSTWLNGSWPQSFNGQLDEVRIWDEARTASQIQSNSNAEFMGDMTDLNYYFKFNEGGGDSTREEVSGALLPIVNASTSNLCWLNNSSIDVDDYAISLSGTDDYVSVAGDFDYDQAYTFQAWIKTELPGSGQGHKSIFYAGGTAGSDIEIYIQETTQNLAIAHNRSNGGVNDSYLQSGLPDNTWFNLAVVFDGTNLEVYVDGSLWTSEVIGAPTKSGAAEITLGYLNSTAFIWNQTFNGALDDVSVWSKALSEEEVIAGILDEVDMQDAALEYHFAFDEGTGSEVMEEVSGSTIQVTNDMGLGWVAGQTTPEEVSLRMEGASDHIALDASAWEYENGYSFATWWNTSLPQTSGAGHRTLFWTGGAIGSDIEIYIQAGTKDVVVVHNRDNGATRESLVVDKDLPDGEWFHFAVTYDGTDVTIYVNGDEFASQEIIAPIHTVNSMANIGYYASTTWINGGWLQIFNDGLDEISIWDAPLIQEDVQDMMFTGLDGDENDLEFYFPIDECYTTNVYEVVSDTEVPVVNAALSSLSWGSHGTFSEDFALWFTGTSDALVGDASALAYDQAYTFEGWIKTALPGSGQGHKCIFYLGGAAGSDVEIYIQENTQDLIVVHNRGNGGTTSNQIHAGVLPNDQWVHVAFAFDGTELETFVNGVGLGAAAIGAPVKSVNPEYSIGHFNSTAFVWSQTFNGAMDDVRIWSGAQSGSQVLSWMGSELEGDENGLWAYFDLNEGLGDTTWNKTNGEAVAIVNYSTGSAWNEMTSKVGNVTCVEMIGEEFSILVNNPGPLDLSTSVNGMIISANQDDAVYQWYNCDLQQEETDEIDQEFMTNMVGTWSVIVDNGCDLDTSACVAVIVGVNDTQESELTFYPNPASEKVFVGEGLVTVFDQRGVIVISTESTGWVNISSLENGLYTIVVGGNRQKLVVQ